MCCFHGCTVLLLRLCILCSWFFKYSLLHICHLILRKEISILNVTLRSHYIYQIGFCPGTKSYELSQRETAQTVHIGIYLYTYFENSSVIFVYLVLRNYSNCVIQQLLIRHEKLYICDKMSHFQGPSGSAVPIKMC